MKNIIKHNITNSNKTIYDEIEIGDEKFWFPDEELESILKQDLLGENLEGMPLRTRSKHVNQLISAALGYPIPKSFKRTQPRFPGQNFDVYTQKTNNLQIWNEEIELSRRYIIIEISDDNLISNVRVINGQELSIFDTTGTLTKKYQANLLKKYIDLNESIINSKDTSFIEDLTNNYTHFKSNALPSDLPELTHIMPIEKIKEKIKPLLGQKIPYFNKTQERKRGDFLHNLISNTLGYKENSEDGQFPDIKNQLLEVKLQTSPTVDLGLFLPTSQEPTSIPKIKDKNIKMSDVRYCVVYGNVIKNEIIIDKIILTSGQEFFKFFRQFQGNEINTKIQIPLPKDFFSKK